MLRVLLGVAAACAPRQDPDGGAAEEPSPAGRVRSEPEPSRSATTAPSSPVTNPPATLPGRDAVTEAIDRAASWLGGAPPDALRFDTAIGLSETARFHDSETVRTALAVARARADADPDHPMHRLWNPDAIEPPESVRSWIVPLDGVRAPLNRVTTEALWCDRFGFRDETLRYISGPMRDAGGYATAHGVWALTLARDRGCIDPDEAGRRIATLVDELADAQPSPFQPLSTGEIDLFAERLLMALRAHDPDWPVTRDLARLLELQRPEGFWAVGEPSTDPTLTVHATMLSAWALSTSLAGPIAAPAAPGTGSD